METPRESVTASDSGGDTIESSAVQVAVRVRPLSASESSQGSEPCVSILADVAVLVGGLSGKQFDFDAAFPATVQQHHVYDALVAPLVDRFFDGYNATVFAYGQTGSGKTFTMGNEFKLSVAPADRGIIPRTMGEIFERIANAPANVNYVLKVSYLEILNEEIHDLLTPMTSQASLSVRDDGKRGICVNGLSEHAVESIEQIATLLHTGALSRATASTTMNAQSSRSHAICTLTMEQYETSGGRDAEAKFSKFHLVDLAGSERAKRTNAEGARFKEGVNINKGLLSLGNVINALAEKCTHVPYRDSKLTRLLQDSLGGNSKTLMIACISPADVNFEETCNTLRYASRARNIQNQAVVNQTLSVESQVTYLKQQLEVMQLQLLQQQQQGKGLCPTGAAMASDTVSSFEIGLLEKEIMRWKSIAKIREEELQLVMSAKDKWKKIADEFAHKKQRGPQVGAVRVHATTGDFHSPKSKALLQDAIEFDKSIHVTQFPSSPAKPLETKANGAEEDNSDNSWETDIDSLEDVIKEKEKIVQALTAANAGDRNSGGAHGPLTALSRGYEQKIRELEFQVTKLAEEKKRLAREMTSKGDTTNGESANGRLHAQLQLVQNQLQVAKQAEKECKRLSHLWKSGTLKISTLEKEIVDMKKQKATLQRQLKEESESHRKEKREQNLKFIQLKRQEQRKQYELQKLTTLHAKQNNVLKRKNEEIASVNKRMRSLVQTQQTAQQLRTQSSKNRSIIAGNRASNGTQDKSTDSTDGDAMAGITRALQEIMNVQMTIAGAKSAIQMELEDRKGKALEIASLENRGDTESASAKLAQLKTALKEKNADIRLLQQKLASVEKNNALPSALFPAKVNLCHQLIRHLVEMVFESKTAALELDNCKSDLEAAEEQLSEQSQRHEEAVTAYKKQLHRLGHFEEVAVDDVATNGELEKLKTELLEVRAQLEYARTQAALATKNTTAAAPVKPKAPAKKLTNTVDLVEMLSSSDDDDDEEEDDDSDYIEEEDADENGAKKKKLSASRGGVSTSGKVCRPLQPRVSSEPKAASAMDEINMLLAKPSAVGGTVCCSCNGKCATKSCACRAEKQSCGPDCSCKESKCHNRGDASKLTNKKRRSDPLHNTKENEVEAFFDLTDKENLQPPPFNQTEYGLDKENAPPVPVTKFKKIWSGNSSSGLSSTASKETGKPPAASGLLAKFSSRQNHNASAIARFF